MKKINIVVYGDSNTYGYSPDGSRYEERYGTVLNKLLGENYIVHEEGVVGRTTIYPDYREGRIGVETIENELSKYNIIDLLIIMLGTNDFKITNARLLSEIENGMNNLISKIKELNNISKVLIVSPILLSKRIDELDKDFDHNSYILSKCASTVYQELAKKNNYLFFDAKEVAFAGDDGEHFTRESHISLGNALYEFIKEGGDLL
jgi:lysophospholipase L1-like esterase